MSELPAPMSSLDEVAADLREVHAKTTLVLVVAVATILTDRIFGGDPAAWRSNRGSNTSLRRLASRPDVPFSASSLYRALAVNELVHRLGGLSASRGLCAAHFHHVLTVSRDHQTQLLQRAQNESWTARQFGEYLRGLGEAVEPRPRVGRKRVPPLLRELKRLDKVCADPEGPLGADGACKLAQSDAQTAAEMVERAIARLEKLRDRLQG